MPASKHRAPKSSRRPAGTNKSAPRTTLPAPIQPHNPPSALPELAEMNENEREIDLSALSPRQQAALRSDFHNLETAVNSLQ